MNKRYEALLALDTSGKEDGVRDTVERLEKLCKAEGADVEQVQRLEKREFAYEHNHLKAAYYINVIFSAPAPVLEKLRAKLKLDEDVTLQNFLKLPEKKAQAAVAAA